MSTPHNKANKGEIAKTVIMPGDPLRAKYVAENYLENARLVNNVRQMYAYTGKYKGKDITVMASGMGVPSMGIYSYELYKFYDVENIIRIGSCGAYKKELNLFDIILSEKTYSEGNYALSYNNDDCHIIKSDENLNNIIKETAKEKSINLYCGDTVCIDCFDPYVPNIEGFLSRIPKDFNPLCAEMEAFALFYNAYSLGKKATAIMSVVDSKYIDTIATPEEREKGLNDMIELALDSCLKI